MQPLRGARRLFVCLPHLRAGLALLLVLALGIQAQWDFDAILRKAEQRWGDLGPARQRIRDWGELLQSARGQDEAGKLKAANDFFNASLAFRDDRSVWGQEDYWATPVEALYKGAGDCEDYAIAKYVTLRQLGIPSDKLRITYVKALRLNQAHMVLTYYPRPEAVPLVLDNLIGSILPASQRDDLQPVYAFNGEGLWLADGGGGKQVGDSKRLSRWQDLLRKMEAEGFPSRE